MESVTQEVAQSAVWSIDVHAHLYASAFTAFMESHGHVRPQLRPGNKPIHTGGDDDHSLRERLALMDAACVERQILSPTLPPYLAEEANASHAARLLNARFSEIATAFPGRFSHFVSLPLPWVEASLTELSRALDEPGAVGVTLHCFCGDLSIADEAFDPLYAELDQRGAVLFLHPTGNALHSPFIRDWKLAGCAGPSLEDAVIVMHLIARSVPYRFPNIKFVIPHLGGVLPVLLRRLDMQMPQVIDGMKAMPSTTARTLWYDTACHGSTAALRCAVDELGVERLIAGSDFPVLLNLESYGETLSVIERCGLSQEDCVKIRRSNILELFKNGLGDQIAAEEASAKRGTCSNAPMPGAGK